MFIVKLQVRVLTPVRDTIRTTASGQSQIQKPAVSQYDFQYDTGSDYLFHTVCRLPGEYACFSPSLCLEVLSRIRTQQLVTQSQKTALHSTSFVPLELKGRSCLLPYGFMVVVSIPDTCYGDPPRKTFPPYHSFLLRSRSSLKTG